jgi:hypothetical protein
LGSSYASIVLRITPITPSCLLISASTDVATIIQYGLKLATTSLFGIVEVHEILTFKPYL